MNLMSRGPAFSRKDAVKRSLGIWNLYWCVEIVVSLMVSLFVEQVGTSFTSLRSNNMQANKWQVQLLFTVYMDSRGTYGHLF